MFITLLAVTFVISLLVSSIVVGMFAKPIDGILQRIISNPISQAWLKYVKFAIYVVGISSGVRIWELGKIYHPWAVQGRPDPPTYAGPLGTRSLSTDYREPPGYRMVTSGVFRGCLVAFVIVRVLELRKTKGTLAAS